MRKELRAELADVLGLSKKRIKHVPKERDGRRTVLGDVIKLPAKLRGKYKGKVYWAHARKDGRIRFDGHVFDSPSLAATAAYRHPCNGWWFWSYERAPGDWVRLKELKRNARGRQRGQ